MQCITNVIRNTLNLLDLILVYVTSGQTDISADIWVYFFFWYLWRLTVNGYVWIQVSDLSRGYGCLEPLSVDGLPVVIPSREPYTLIRMVVKAVR
jgi:hypothetical protein